MSTHTTSADLWRAHARRAADTTTDARRSLARSLLLMVVGRIFDKLKCRFR
jgi:hypothetical protein